MKLKEIKETYINPEQWLKEQNAQILIPEADTPIIQPKDVNPLVERLKGKNIVTGGITRRGLVY
jgi:CTP:molybdopterin cytidylyltransferase MocA